MDNQVNHARAGMDVLAALREAPAPPDEAASTAPPRHGRRAKRAPAPTPAPVQPATASPLLTTRAPATVVDRPVATASAEAATPAPVDDLVVGPRTGGRRLAGAALLLAAPAAGVTTWAALSQRDTTLGGLALILGALTLGLWFLRVISVPTSVSLLGPHLEVRRGGEHHVWDLASAYSPIDHVRGKPGRSGWRVVLRNPDGSTFAIDGSMVPAKRFTEILSRYRPEL